MEPVPVKENIVNTASTVSKENTVTKKVTVEL